MNKKDLIELYSMVSSVEGLDYCCGLDAEIATDDELYEILEELRITANNYIDACQQLDSYYGKQMKGVQ